MCSICRRSLGILLIPIIVSRTTARSWRNSRSIKQDGSSHQDGTHSYSPFGTRSTWGSCPLASLAQQAGFDARGAAVEASPTWKGIVKTADEHDASLIVLGSHGRTGLASVLIGSVAEAVAAHSRGAVLIIHRGDPQEPSHQSSSRLSAAP